MNIVDFDIFVVTLALQRETGGNLTEALSNLSAIIRGRRELRLKAAALSSEAKASAAVMASLPFLASGALLVLNPAYLMPLVTDRRGPYLLIGAAGLMLSGIGVMKHMISRSVRA